MSKNITSDSIQGIRDGIPIFLGYLSVAFSFGIIAADVGIGIADAVAISASNLTSAGQFAGVRMIAAGAGLAEMALSQLVINMRYFLMSVSLSQKYGSSVGRPLRLAAAFFVTDEIFAVASGRQKALTAKYMFGIGGISAAGWILGTAGGALGGNMLPDKISNALGIALYAMFIAIIVPAAKKRLSVAVVVFVAAAVSCSLTYAELKGLSYGFIIIAATVTASLAGALLFPLKVNGENLESEKA